MALRKAFFLSWSMPRVIVLLFSLLTSSFCLNHNSLDNRLLISVSLLHYRLPPTSSKPGPTSWSSEYRRLGVPRMITLRNFSWDHIDQVSENSISTDVDYVKLNFHDRDEGVIQEHNKVINTYFSFLLWANERKLIILKWLNVNLINGT